MVGIGLIVGGLAIWGMKGLLWGVVLNNWFAYFVNMGLVSNYIGYKWWNQLQNLLPVTIASILSAVLSYFTASFLDLGLYLDGIAKVLVYIALYMGWSIVFKPEAFGYTQRTIRPMIEKIYKRKKL